MSVNEQFYQHLLSVARDQGFGCPSLLLLYLTELLGSRLGRVDIIPDPSFAERYLQLLQNYDYGEYKDYADSALFFCGLMPEYGIKRGLSRDYYQTLGISVYYSLGDRSRDERFTQLGNWFPHLQQFLRVSIHRGQLKLVEFGSSDVV